MIAVETFAIANECERITIPLSSDRIAYLAGIIDGEGCISFGGRLKKKYVTVTLQITNTNRTLIDWLSENLGGSIYERRDIRPNRKQSWLWSCAGRRATEIIRTVSPYLIVKKEQAEVVLSLPRIREFKRDSSGRLIEMISDEERNTTMCLVSKIRELNRRGMPVEIRKESKA